MSKIFVGQRVRMVRPLKHMETLGRTGRVRELFPRDSAIAVDWDCGVRDLIDAWRYTHIDSVEPITPSGHRASDYSFSELMGECREVMA